MSTVLVQHSSLILLNVTMNLSYSKLSVHYKLSMSAVTSQTNQREHVGVVHRGVCDVGFQVGITQMYVYLNVCQSILPCGDRA